MTSKKVFLKGVLLCTISASFWAIGGNFTQYIFIHSNLDFVSLTSFRMLISGLALSLIAFFSYGIKPLKKLVFNRAMILPLLLYSIFAQITIQVPFFATIHYSSPAFATLMSTLAPVIVLLYFAIHNKTMPSILEISLVVIMLIGLFFVITNANIHTLKVDIRAVIWGFLSCLGYSFYLIYSKKFRKFPSSYIVGITMVIGSIFLVPITNYSLVMTSLAKTNVLIVFLLLILIGTIIPFNFFLESTKLIGPKIASILSVLEPIVSLLIMVYIFKEVFTILQLIGAILVILAVIVLSSIED